MSNDNHNDNNEKEQYDYRFIDYRLDQLEARIKEGLQKLEKEYSENNKELMKTLHFMQESNNEQNKQIIEIIQRQKSMEEKMACIDKLKEVATKNTTHIKELERRIEVYKQILFVVGTGVAVALIIDFIKLI